MLVVVCPGQGSQTPGMLSSWLALDGARELCEDWSQVSGVDLITHGTTSAAETIRDTAIAQPLLVAASLLSAHYLQATPQVVAGHSVGEFAAAALAGVFSPAQAIALVAARGRAMAAAAALAPTGMCAVVGGDPAQVHAAIAAAGLTAANVNSATQVVAAGTTEQLAALQPPARARVIALPVAGAFHTAHMAPAVAALRAAFAQVECAAPRLPLVLNADGATVATGTQVAERLIAQVAQPVRWDLCQQAFSAAGVTALCELAPGGVLTGLAKRSLPQVATYALRDAPTLEAAREFIACHGGKDAA